MSDLILHQYADSPFSEKIRALLGYKNLSCAAVEIPAIMPKPDLTALTGGYRRTPVMQRGADVYCDTALIAEIIEDSAPDPAIFDREDSALAIAAARWTDSEFFRVCVGLVFQPRALAANPRFKDPAVAEAFIKDRSEFTAGSQGMAVPLPRAEAVFREHMGSVEALLKTRTFMGGETPDILDFSTWHCCWFVARQEVLQEYFAPYPAVLGWMERMNSYGGAVEHRLLSGEEAVAIAKQSAPLPISDGVDPVSGLSAGVAVQVLPTDYGFQPVQGELLSVTDRRISIARDDDRAGRVHVHFPRYGFEVSATGDKA